MNKTFHPLIFILTSSLSGMTFGQDAIPVAEPVREDNGPLRATPEEDQLRIADMLFAQAQEARNNPDEYKRMLTLSAQRYSQFVQAYPRSPHTPLAMYRLASCLMDTGQSAEAYQVFGNIVQRYKGDVAAAAAYRLATEAYKKSDWGNASRFYQTTIEQGTQDELKNDATYRLGRVYVAQKKTAAAIEQFRKVVADPKSQPAFRQAAMMSLAALVAEQGRHEEAYGIYKDLLKDTDLDAQSRGTAMLQAASLASLLKKDDEARAFYDQLIRNPELGGKSAEAQAGLLIGLYKQGKYREAVQLYEQGQIETTNKALEAKRRLVVGQAYYKLKDYPKAVALFAMAEKSSPHTEIAMEAAYRRLICQNELKDPDFAAQAQAFLNAYAKAFPTSPYHDLVRLMAAESLFTTNPGQAAAYYEAINLDKVDKEMKADIIYRDAWACGKAGNREKAIALLDLFMRDYPRDPRVPVAMAFRGDMNMQTGREVDALRDFEEVIRNWPRHDAAALAWQKTARLYNNKQDTVNMIKSYEGLLKNFPKAMPVALAEARFMVGRGYFDRKEFDKAIPNLEEARTLNPEKYTDQVNMLLVLGYYQMQNAPKLREVLDAMRDKDPELLNGVPETIPAWLGIQAFNTRDYATADRYLTLATKNNELKRAKRVIWKNLAKARLALKRYETALVAVDFYLQEEQQPFGKVEGQLDKAAILLGLGKHAEARKTAEEGLAAGVEGPLMASLRIVLGDIAYAEKKYDEAAKQYVMVAELFVQDKELKPEALYKAYMSLEKAGRVADAAVYKSMLDKEFPGWKPASTQELPASGQ